MDWQIALVVSAALFGAFLIWKMRPRFFSPGRGKATTLALREAKKKLDEAKDDIARAEALCEAGDVCARSLGRTTGAVGYYLRAMRANPGSAELVERAAQGLARRPYALEGLLWRRLGAEPWTGPGKSAAVAALTHLSRLYDGPIRSRPRARAIDHALAALGENRPSRSGA